MKIIKKLYEQIEDELSGGLEYARCAVNHKEDHPALAKVWYDIAQVEVGHAETLHRQVVSVIGEYRAKNGEPPEAMRAVYEFLHERSMEKMQEIKRYLELYRTM